ncbi:MULTISPECIES: TRAP transporter substrate-binding protein [unclassified Halomonas]|uniref:TRAP transporter substrate-binding protein n=1 Tax=unclassified Halomonas TaxID=2609666 RepID=UPI0040340833
MRKLIACMITPAILTLTPLVQADEHLIRIATSVPEAHYLTQSVKRFADEVAERTNGDITFEIYPAQSLVTDQQMDQAVSNGTVDIGVASASILAGTIPAFNIFAVPFLFDTSEKLEQSVTPNSPIREILDGEMEKKGFVTPFWIPYGSIVLVTREEPVRTPDDIQDMKVRTFGSTVSDFIEAVGGLPVVTSGGEQFLALQRGIVDGGLTGWSSVLDRRLYEVTDNVTALNHMYETHFALMNQQVWQSLSDDQRQIFEDAGQALEAQLSTDLVDETEQVKQDLRDHMTVIELNDDERAQWQEASSLVADDFYEQSDAVSRKVFEEAEKIQ